MASTTYSITGPEVSETKSKKSAAIALADKLADENRGVTFEVSTNAGTVVHTALRKAKGTHAAPWTRVDSSPKVEDIEVPAGFTTAYVRTRIPAIVCRADDKSGWLVVTPTESFEAKDTKEAREITNDLGAKAKAARQEAAAAAKAQKAADREAAKQAKADAKAQAEAEKAEAEQEPVAS